MTRIVLLHFFGLGLPKAADLFEVKMTDLLKGSLQFRGVIEMALQ